METAKVDIRKLQLLNDRINQCIDALNQVRLSVHGLSGTAAGVQGGVGAGQTPGFGAEYGFGLTHSGLGQNPFAQNPFAQSGIGQYAQSGLGQTGAVPFASPFGPTPTQGYFPGFIPTGFPQQPTAAAFGIGVNPLVAGLAHTSPVPMWVDPLLSARIAQTFPYAQLPIPPVVTIY
jgi:hypothetical protein